MFRSVEQKTRLSSFNTVMKASLMPSISARVHASKHIIQFLLSCHKNYVTSHDAKGTTLGKLVSPQTAHVVLNSSYLLHTQQA